MVSESVLTAVTLQSNGGGGGFLVFWLVLLTIAVVSIAGMWKTFEKAGKPGWGVLIPFYNTYLMLKIGGNSGWWMLGLLVPIVGFLVALKMTIDIAERFGRGILFGLGLGILSFVFFPILGFGDATYRAPETETIHEEWA